MIRAIETLSDALTAIAADKPDHELYVFLDERGNHVHTMTAGELLVRAQRLAFALRKVDGANGPVLVCTGPGPDQPVALFGCGFAGMIAVPVYPPNPGNENVALETIAEIATSSGARVLVAPQALGAKIVTALQQRMNDAAPKLVILNDDFGELLDTTPRTLEETALVLYTSGSVGAPKGVIITHAALLENMRALVEGSPSGAMKVICTWLPHGHIAGLYTRLLGVVAISKVIVLPPQAFAMRPAIWLETMSTYGATFSAAPDFAYALCADTLSDAHIQNLDLSAWRMAVSGGEKVRPATVERFFRRLQATGIRAEALHPYYGMTETLCTSVPQGTPAIRLVASKLGIQHGRIRPPANDEDVVELMGNGPPLGENTRVIAVDPESLHPCAPNRIGELWCAGKSTTPGYFRNDTATQETRGVLLDDDRGSYFRTGDLGLVYQGQVFVTGRLKELLIVRGKNHYPSDIEATIVSARAGLPDGSCAAFTVIQDHEEALGVAIEMRGDLHSATGVIRAARRAVANGHGLAIAQLYLLPPGTLPRTPTQKIARKRCLDQAMSGVWDEFAAANTRRRADISTEKTWTPPLAGLSDTALRAALLARVVEVIGRDSGETLSEDELCRPISELGKSSLEIARIAAHLRRTCGVEPPFAALFDGTSIRGLADLMAAQIEGHGKRSAGPDHWRDDVCRVAMSLPNLLHSPRRDSGALLLTGATGFLGSYLLANLLANDKHQQIRCVVRAENEAGALERLIRALRAGPGFSDEWISRLQALPGDITERHFGWDDRTWRWQLEQVATIVHNAANVNFVAPYQSLHPFNVAPAQTIVELATTSPTGCKTVHLVSTLAVFNATYRREQRLIRGIDRLLKPDHLYSGYAQTKWVAEACFRTAGSRGMPLGIHRPGLITGATRNGFTNTDDFLCRFIKGCIELGFYPDAEVELDLCAVDDVAAGIAAAISQPVRDIDTFHWSNPKPVLLRELMRVYQERGHTLVPESLPRWLERIRTRLPMANALFPVHPFLLEKPPGSDETILEFMDGLPLEIETFEADEARRRAGITSHPVNHAVMNAMAAWLEREGHLPARNS